MLSIYHESVGHLHVFFGKRLFRASAHFPVASLVLFGIELYEFFVGFGLQPLSRVCVVSVFSQ